MQALYEELAPRGFTILGFPCNQFGRQEPGTNQQIQQFATETHGAQFPLFAKVRVNGADAHPFWKFLKSSLKGTFGQSIKWNFTKFLVDQNGIPVKRYGTPTNPFDIRKDIEALLQGEHVE